MFFVNVLCHIVKPISDVNCHLNLHSLHRLLRESVREREREKYRERER